MKFSEQWLREWVNPKLGTAELAHQLTMAGLEVDAIEPVAGAFDKVVVGEVLRVEPHPDADKLRIASVNVGAGEVLSIVCGAANVRAGLKVPTALVGAILPGGMKIKQSKLRGVASAGMLCSASELGLAESASGLLELAADAPVGTDVRKVLGLDDVSIELGLTPNRGDCLSVAGIAREVAVLNQLSVSPPDMKPHKAAIKDSLNVRLQAPEACPAYAGRIIRGIDPTAVSPLWLQERLRRSGLRSLGAVVDITNYVLLELGQPMHAFDLAKLQGGIQVRYARAGESLLLLDGQTVELDDGALVIADDKQALAFAGIMGGAASAVGTDTSDIFLESAFFSPPAIAGKARQYGLHTDSSHRFERGVDPELQVRALERATALVMAICGGKVGPVVHEVAAQQLPVRAPVRLRSSRIARVLGASLADDEVTAILQRLGMQVCPAGRDESAVFSPPTGSGGDKPAASLVPRPSSRPEGPIWLVTPPGFRFDINLEVDLIEELGRIHGYDRLPSTRPAVRMRMAPRSETRLSLQRCKALLVDLGYQEAITYSFVEPGLQNLLDPQQSPLALANPISSDLAVMRTSLWPGLVQSLQHNLNRQQDRLRLFEFGLRFVNQGADLKQESVLAGLVMGSRLPSQWGTAGEAGDFYDLKGHVEALLALTRRSAEFTFTVEPRHPALHPGQSAAILLQDQPVGWLGALHPDIQHKLDLAQPVFVFELGAQALQARALPAFATLSKYPMIRRDIAIVLDQAVSSQNVSDCIRSAASKTLTKVELFDVYVGEGIDSGRKSLALGLTLQDLSRTLTDSDVEQEINHILAVLNRELGATLRE